MTFLAKILKVYYMCFCIDHWRSCVWDGGGDGPPTLYFFLVSHVNFFSPTKQTLFYDY